LTAAVTSIPAEDAPVAASSNELISIPEVLLVEVEDSSELRAEVELMRVSLMPCPDRAPSRRPGGFRADYTIGI
jgi:hypothetical protein